MTANALPGWFRRKRKVDSAPPPATDAEDVETVSQSTTGGELDQEPVVVWEAAHRMEAEIVAGRLASEGIPTIIRGEALGAIYGFTTGSLAAAEVLVPAALAEKALAILDNEVEAEGEWETLPEAGDSHLADDESNVANSSNDTDSRSG